MTVIGMARLMNNPHRISPTTRHRPDADHGVSSIGSGPQKVAWVSGPGRHPSRGRFAGVCLIVLLWVTPMGLAEQTLESTPEGLFSHQMALLAWRSLVSQGPPRSDQLVRARVLLDLALHVNPDDAELWRLRGELAKQMEDRAGELEALRQYCGQRPEDDAAQLAWIMASVEKHQTIDERVQAIRRILDGPTASEELTAALRSHLSTYIAKGALESGDTPQFTPRLKAALRLDRSNQEAGRLLYQWLADRGASLDKIGKALSYLIWTNPIDPPLRRQLAQILLSQGAFQAAAQQFQAAKWLTPGMVDQPLVYSWVLSVAASGQIEQALDLLADYETFLRLKATQSQEQESDTPPPAGESDLAGLPMDLELLRLAILTQTGQRIRAQGSFKRLKLLLQARIDGGQAQAKADLVWLSLLLEDRQPDPKELQTARELWSDQPTLVRRLIGWEHLRAGELVAARGVLSYSARDDPFAAYGVAQTYTQADDPNRIDQLQQVVTMSSGSLAGMMAANDLAALGITPTPTADGQRLVDLVEAWPDQLKLADPNPPSWLGLSVKIEPGRYDFLEPITAQLTLRNLTDIPLAIGPSQTVPSRLMIHLTLRRAGQTKIQLPPLVSEINRRLTLLPRGKLEVAVRLDQADLGEMMSMAPVEAMSFDVFATLEPPATQETSSFIAALLNATHSTYLIKREGIRLTGEWINRWIAMLRTTDSVQQMISAVWLVHLGVFLDGSSQTQELADSIAQAVNHEYDRLTPTLQAWMIRFLPPGEQSNVFYHAVHESAQRSDDPTVRIVYAATQITEADSPQLNALLRHPDPLIVEFAQALRIGLEIEAAEKKAQEEAQEQQSDQDQG